MTRIPPKLLLDEHGWHGLIPALDESGFEILHLNDTDRRSISDEDVLVFASSEGRAVLTYNTRQFVPLARQWFEEGREHSGIILSTQVSRGALLRSVRNLAGDPFGSRASQRSPVAAGICWIVEHVPISSHP